MYQRLDPAGIKYSNRKKRLFSFGRFAEWLIFSAVLSALVLIASPYLPTKKFFSSFIVSSGSMEPTIRAGSVAIVMPIDPELIREKDVIAFESPENSRLTILHRVQKITVSRNSRLFMTGGDNNREADRWQVKPAEIKGLMFFAIPFLGHAAATVRNPWGFLLLIGVPALVLGFFQIREIAAGIEEEARKRAYNLSLFIGAALLAGFSLNPFFARTIVAIFSSTATVSGISITSRDFAPPPAPLLLSPEDNIVRETQGLVMDWSDVSDYENMSPPVYYIYQSTHNSGFSPLAYQSGQLSASQIPAPGTPDGVYFWRVKACDQLHNCSPWSEVRKATIDSRPPLLSSSRSEDGLTVIYTLSRLSRFASYNYILSYDTDSLPQAYEGTVILSGQNEDGKSFYLGTYSPPDYTPHTGIHNLKLKIDVYSPAGTHYPLEVDL
ncbi:MAG: type I signal peptidase, signal peptidase, endoplasmic reticulum-type [Candidatus Gottesmanbacteria bacterium GW2011_GWA2_43_14]|uniref:Signal peptidase I n=1 Tax=Candidatus Gottesmanbacteria bacterium GW2011_GWA2_43_14 TaxID=1618443 RepID=A0A0G1DIU4_9BACT|nr:MAG: type I signal peptidase, signal peptidase, endoplasmic reticulum-type [Candidatus Gottesmanbacteria bacterium GW2011_GWA2_43_14]